MDRCGVMVIVERLFLLSLVCELVESWSNEELALYDLVEEVNSNFYELFSVKQDATLSEIKRAYRRLSMELHPDRNQAEDANEQFRRIAAIYEVLKSPQLREKYDSVLEFGLPDWRQPIYYFRRARKLSWLETMFVILGISTITHYLMLWGAYIEKYWVLLSKSGKARKKELRQARKAGVVKADDAVDASISAQLADERPTLRKLLPFLILSTLYRMALLSPTVLEQSYKYFCAPLEPPEEDEPKQIRAYMELSPQPVYEYAVADDLKPVLTNDFVESRANELNGHEPNHSMRGEKWSCDELELLVKLTTEKYPSGTPDRWKLVGRILGRSPEEVASMTGKLKLVKRDEYAKLLRGAQSSSAVMAAANVTALKVGTRESNGTVDKETAIPMISSAQPSDHQNSKFDGWSQHDQRLFETALQQFPKGTADRWDKIVNCVPNKTKQQCIDRFKYLSEMVRQRKLQHKNKK